MTEPGRQLHVAIVGCGAIAENHYTAYSRLDDTVVTAVCDVKKEAAKAFAGKHKVLSYYTDPSEMFRSEELDIESICTPPGSHADLSVAAISRKINVIVEKPMTGTLEQAECVLNSLKGSSVKFMIVHNWLFSPAMLKARSLVEEGVLGEIVSVDVRVIQTQNDDWLRDSRHWVHSVPGGRIGEILAHPIYIVQAFLGTLTVDQVFASKLGQYPWVRFDELRVIVRSGRRYGEIYVTLNAPRNIVFVDIYGTKAILKSTLINQTSLLLKEVRRWTPVALMLDNLNQSYQLLSSTLGKIPKHILPFPYLSKSPHEVCIDSFVKNIRANTTPIVGPKAGYETIKVFEEICKRIPERDLVLEPPNTGENA
jgi:predicted dehydrogenase